MNHHFALSKKRNRSVVDAKGFDQLAKNLSLFMNAHNFIYWQHMAIFHMLNDFYAMGIDLGKCSETKINFNWEGYFQEVDESKQ